MAAVPTEISAELFATWLTPMQALARLSSMPVVTARQTILEQLQHNILRASARTTSSPELDLRENLKIIPRRAWAAVGGLAFVADPFWSNGQFKIGGGARVDSEPEIAFFDVRIEPAGIETLAAGLPQPPNPRVAVAPPDGALPDPPPAMPAPLPPPAPEPVQEPSRAATAVNKGGRPRKDWWPDLWFELCVQALVRDLTAESQGELERAIAKWLEANDHDHSEATVQRAAQRLFRAFRERDQN